MTDLTAQIEKIKIESNNLKEQQRAIAKKRYITELTQVFTSSTSKLINDISEEDLSVLSDGMGNVKLNYSRCHEINGKPPVNSQCSPQLNDMIRNWFNNIVSYYYQIPGSDKRYSIFTDQDYFYTLPEKYVDLDIPVDADSDRQPCTWLAQELQEIFGCKRAEVFAGEANGEPFISIRFQLV